MRVTENRCARTAPGEQKPAAARVRKGVSDGEVHTGERRGGGSQEQRGQPCGATRAGGPTAHRLAGLNASGSPGIGLLDPRTSPARARAGQTRPRGLPPVLGAAPSLPGPWAARPTRDGAQGGHIGLGPAGSMGVLGRTINFRFLRTSGLAGVPKDKFKFPGKNNRFWRPRNVGRAIASFVSTQHSDKTDSRPSPCKKTYFTSVHVRAIFRNDGPWATKTFCVFRSPRGGPMRRKFTTPRTESDNFHTRPQAIGQFLIFRTPGTPMVSGFLGELRSPRTF